MAANAKRYELFTVTEHKDKRYWHKLGVAFENRDGSFSLKLFGLPVDGELQMREWEDKKNG